MKVFISWSGDDSRQVAILLREWLPTVMQSLSVYVSSEDNEKGARWSNVIAKELEGSSFGILCVTKENLHKPWLTFEAGALSKTVDKSYVAPFLFNIKRSEVSGPLLQFHSTIFKKDEIKKLVVTINNVNEKRITDKNLDRFFNKWYPDLECSLKNIKTNIKVEKKAVREDAILEEILELSRSNQKLLTSTDNQYLNPIKDELSKIIYNNSYIKRFNQDEKLSLWKTITSSIYEDNFPLLSDRIHEGIIKNYFPIKQKYYIENYERNCIVGWDDSMSRTVRSSEDVSMEIIPNSDMEVINQSFSYIAEIKNNIFDTTIELLELKVDNEDYSEYFKKEVVTDDIKTTIKYSYSIPLKGKKKYFLKRKMKKVFSLSNDPYSRYYSNTFILGTSIKLEVETKGLRVQFVESGTYKQFESRIEEESLDCGKIGERIDKYFPNILFPRQGYVLHYECDN